ncbi:MAG TPA: ribokinase [Dehalococcoidia bacterium]|nr:ribokinase [Dehalococcoidia bacterium]|tara:strand:- start:1487 stop:2416 length:930 start_codon:yes stop_codon:yes gene_type:complete
MTQQANSGGVVVLGGINMDLVTISARFPRPGETVVGSRFLTYPGGKGANQAVAAARMGAATAMVGRVGDDVFGPQLIETLRDSGIKVDGVAVAQDTTSGIAVINIDESAQNQIIQILGANDTCGDAEAVRVGQALVNASTLLLQLEVSVDLSLKVAKEAFEQGKTVILDPGPVRHIPSEFFAYCSVITPNETEAQALVGFPVVDRTSAAQAAEQLLARGVGIAVVKLGAQGVYFANADGGDFVTPFQVDAIDSVAAGDAFNGALAVSLAEGATLEQSVRMAAAAGALAVTKSGAQDSMPYRKEVEGLLG